MFEKIEMCSQVSTKMKLKLKDKRQPFMKNKRLGKETEKIVTNRKDCQQRLIVMKTKSEEKWSMEIRITYFCLYRRSSSSVNVRNSTELRVLVRVSLTEGLSRRLRRESPSLAKPSRASPRSKAFTVCTHHAPTFLRDLQL